MATQPRNPLVKRMLRAARLDPALYREVAEDETATTEAMLVVVLAVGLILAGVVLGVLDVQQDSVGGLGESDVDLLQLIASQVAAALQNARAYSEAQRQAQREAQLGDIGGRIQETSNVEDALKVAVRELSLALDKDTFVRLVAEKD